MQTSRLQMRIMVPPRKDMIRIVQNAAADFAIHCGFEPSGSQRIELAVEEAYSTVLRYSFYENEYENEGGLEWCFELDPPCMRAAIIDFGLPFDLSMVPDFRADELSLSEAENCESALSFHLLKHCTDTCSIVNQGKKGIRLELSWFLPGENIADSAEPTAAPAEQTPPAAIETIQILDQNYVIQVARLVYRGYGYSYVYEDVYYPERVRAHYVSGALKSWGAITAEGRLAGHLALMKDTALPNAVEWGLVVVDPGWRGMRIMDRMLEATIEHVNHCGIPVFYAHAVTNHPYTQKTCEGFNFRPSALLLCYAPATLRFKGIHPDLKQRESTFVAVRMMQPLPPDELYLPPQHAGIIKRIIKALDIPRDCMPDMHEADESIALNGVLTQCKSMLISSINGATITVGKTGEDCRRVLLHEMRRLCNERVDIIYLTVDLTDKGAVRMVQAAEAAGFFLAGVAPSIMGPDYGFTLQYMNNIKIDFDVIHAFSPAWQQLKTHVMQEKERVESL